jgi:hypothetical protein
LSSELARRIDNSLEEAEPVKSSIEELPLWLEATEIPSLVGIGFVRDAGVQPTRIANPEKMIRIFIVPPYMQGIGHFNENFRILYNDQ